MIKEYAQLVERANEIVGNMELNGFRGNAAGEVAAALLTRKGDIFTGICIDVACGLGFCAEHAAIAEMLKHRQTEIEAIVAVQDGGKIIPPCGRCRELMMQVDVSNCKTKVIVGEDVIVTLEELLPFRWNA